MTSLISADLRRILRKPAFLAILLLCSAFSAANAVWQKKEIWNSFAYAAGQGRVLTGLFVLLLGLAIFLSIFADDFLSGAMKVTVGRGLSRAQVIAAKILDCVLLSVLCYAFLAALQILIGMFLGAELVSEDIRLLLLSACSGAFQVICCTPCAVVVFFLTDNLPFSTFMDLSFLVIIPLALQMTSEIVLFHNLHLRDYYIAGFSQRFLADAMLGGGGLPTLLCGLAFWLGISSLLSILIFGKKELDL